MVPWAIQEVLVVYPSYSLPLLVPKSQPTPRPALGNHKSVWCVCEHLASCDASNDSFSLGQEHMIQNEVSILRRVKHPNIVLLIEEMDVPTELYLVMELVKVRILERERKQSARPSWVNRARSLFPPPTLSLLFLCVGATVKSIDTRILLQKVKFQP